MKNDKSLITIRSTDEYKYTVEDCRAILAQRLKNSRVEMILAYGEVGEKISKSDFYQKYAKGNQELVEGLAKDIGIGYSEACRAVQFYEKYGISSEDSLTSETMKQFEEGENISWYKIKTKYLNDGDPKGKSGVKQFYKLEEILNAFTNWFNNSKSTQASEAVDEFERALTKKL